MKLGEGDLVDNKNSDSEKKKSVSPGLLASSVGVSGDARGAGGGGGGCPSLPLPSSPGQCRFRRGQARRAEAGSRAPWEGACESESVCHEAQVADAGCYHS